MMSLFQTMQSRLRASVGNGFSTDPLDVVQIRWDFSNLGRLDDDLSSGFVDSHLARTIRDFQRDKGLREDGLIRPGGETERAIRRDLGGDTFFGPYYGDPGRIELLDGVGKMQANRKEDVQAVQSGLGRSGFLSDVYRFEPSGILDFNTDGAIRSFQQKNDLRVDGLIFPGGETEGRYNTLAARLTEGGGDGGGDGGDGSGDGSGDGGGEAPPSDPGQSPDDGGGGGEPVPPIPPRKPEPPEEEPKKDCSDLAFAYEEVVADLERKQAALSAAQDSLEVLKSELADNNAVLEKETGKIHGDKGKSRYIGGALGLTVGGLLANLPGAAAGLGAGAALGPIVEEISDNVTVNRTDGELRSRREFLKSEIEALEAEIPNLQAELLEAQELVQSAKIALEECKSEQKE